MFDIQRPRQHVVWLATLAVCLFVLFDVSPALNFEISGWFFSLGSGSFSGRDNFWLSTVLHDYAKNLTVVYSFTVLLLWVASCCDERLRDWRWPLGYVLVAGSSAALSVDLLKDMTNQACPWNLQQFGGDVTFHPWFAFVTQTSSHCWPGGHASSGFALFAWFFVLVDRGNRELARRVLLGVFLYGNLLGFAQILRGAHFFSDHLWTALICWAVSWIVFQVWPKSISVEPQQRFQ